jgi:ATP-binding cassette subfamily B protein
MTSADASELKQKPSDKKLAIRLWFYLKPNRSKLFIALVLTIAVAYLGPLRPYLMQLAVDEHIATGDTPGLLRIVALLFFALFAESGLLIATTYLTRWIGQDALYRMRNDLFAKIQSLHVQYFDRNPIGRLITRTTSDIESLDDLLSNGVVTILGDFLRIVFIFYFMVTLNWELTAVSMIIMPVLIYTTVYFKEKLRVAFLRVRDQVARINAFIQEHINGMAVVQLFARERQEYEKFRAINADHRDAHIETIFYFAVFWPVVEVISSIAMALVIWYGGAQTLSSSLSFGILLAFIQYVRQFFMPIRDLAEKFNTLQSAFASSERIFTVFDTENPIRNPESPEENVLKTGTLEFRDVWFRYDKDGPWVIKGMSFFVESGTTLAVVGATGSGKTTLINLLTRFYDIEKGQILLDGIDIRSYDLTTLRRRFGVVLQEHALFSGSILENITLGNAAISMESVKKAAELVGASRFIEAFPDAYDHKLMERGNALSTGQRQLICFVRALVYNPEILILDEATSNIDSETESMVSDAVNVLMKGRTSLVIAHRLSTIQHAHKILVLHKGELREQGTHDELVKKKDGIYRKLYLLQYKEKLSISDTA